MAKSSMKAFSLRCLITRGVPKLGVPTYECANYMIALDANMFRTTWLHLILTMMEYFPETVSTSSEITKGVIAGVISTIDDMCATIPLTLQITPSGKGDPPTPHDIHGRRGHYLLFPLMICGRCFQRTDIIQQDKRGRRYWIEAVARFVSEELGYTTVPLGGLG
jgi:hypothetical protein